MSHDNYMLAYAEGDVRSVLQSEPVLDRAATRELVHRLYAGQKITETDDGTMFGACAPEDEQLYAAVFPGLTVVYYESFLGAVAAGLPPQFRAEARGRTMYTHSMVSGGGFFTYSILAGDGETRRALAVSGEDGVMENTGEPLPFEADYWAAPEQSDPADLAEDALRALFGYVYQGEYLPDDPDLGAIVLAGYRVG